MKIYTRKGDMGTTSLFGGTKVSKFDFRVEAYGSIDELNSFLGLFRDSLPSKYDGGLTGNFLLEVQHMLFYIGSMLASEKVSKFALTHRNVQKVESEIDRLDAALKPLKNFILPGGHTLVSQCHVVRAVCRRAERKVVVLNEKKAIKAEILMYLNRLSDYFFVLARKLSKDLSIQEVIWNKELV